MDRRVPLIPLPARLARALAALRRLPAPASLEERLRVRLLQAALEEQRSRGKRRLIVLGGVFVAILMDLAPVMAAAQAPAPATQVAPAGDAGADAPPTSPSVQAPDDNELSVSFERGVRFEAPAAAALVVELHAARWPRAEVDHDRERTADFFPIPVARESR
jgi:hypothetical protein